MKRTLQGILAGLALCVAALVNLAAPSVIRAGVVACGDVNGDGGVNIGDALIVAQYDGPARVRPRAVRPSRGL